MTTTIMGRLDRRGLRVLAWLSAFALLASIILVNAVSVRAVHDTGEFELDKNASNNVNVTAVGYLASNINASATQINICRTGDLAVGDTILIRAERMTITGTVTGNFGGNCPGTKQIYQVTRGTGGTVAAAQSGGAQNIGARVSLIEEPVAKDGPDWNQVYTAWLADPDTSCTALGLVECTFIHDGIGPTTFTGGATKDHLPISGWRHTSGASPDKGEILNAYAAKAIEADGDQVLYFGMDRYAVDGSTDIGFWFFQSEVSLNANGTFSGEHQEGDILVLATFTQGGAATNLRVFTWVNSGGSEQTHLDGGGVYGDCVPGTLGDKGCATVNDTTIEVPWNYTFKGESVGKWIPAGGFFEGGLNLTENNLDGCFSSFLAETRSSPEVTSILKDFALGAFEACDSGLVTTPSDGLGVALTDTNNNGIPDITIGAGDSTVSVRDSAVLDIVGTSEWSGTLSFYLCGPIVDPKTGADFDDPCATGGDPYGIDIPVNQTTAQPILSAEANVGKGYYCWRGVFTSNTEGVPDATDSSESECFEVLQLLQPTIGTTQSFIPNDSATITVPAGGGDLDGEVTFKLYVNNDGNCSGTATETFGPIAVSATDVGSDPLTDTAETENTTISYTESDGVNGVITFHWVVEFDSFNDNHLDVTSPCGNETSTITIDDGVTQPVVVED